MKGGGRGRIEKRQRERERDCEDRGERMKEEWVGGRAARTRRRRRMKMRRREKLALATVMGVPLPVPARSKVYCGFNFTFPQPIRRRLRLLRGTLTHSENLTVKDLKLDSASPTNSLCSLFFFLLLPNIILVFILYSHLFRAEHPPLLPPCMFICP